MAASMSEQTFRIDCADGFPLSATLYPGANGARRAVVIAAAMGVPRRFYTSFARYLAERGLTTLTFDYRGIADSSQGPVPGAQIRMEDWGRLDIDSALSWMLREQKPAKTFLLGHSAGGQLAGLAPTSSKLTGLVFAAVSSAYWGHWRGPSRLGMLALMYGMVPALSAGRDFYPAKKGGLSTIPIPAGVTSQWSRWARRRGYLYDPAHKLDLANYRRLSQPLLAFQFDDDNYAPQSAHEAILAAYPNAAIQRRPVRAREHGGKVGHFGYFRDQHRDTLWRETADWLQTTG
jgi:predicted alpha/beta hydrolase